MYPGELFIRSCLLFFVQVLIQQHEIVAEAVAEAVAANLHSHFFPVQHSCFNSETNISFSLTLKMLIYTDLHPSESFCRYKI